MMRIEHLLICSSLLFFIGGGKTARIIDLYLKAYHDSTKTYPYCGKALKGARNGQHKEQTMLLICLVKDLKEKHQNKQFAGPLAQGMTYKARRFEGGMFANVFALRHGCQLCQRMAKYVIFHRYLVSKIYNKGICLPVWGATQCWQTHLSKRIFIKRIHMSVGLPGSLWQPFELKT